MKTKLSPLALSLALFSIPAYADNLCVPSGYTFGFFNGVWNTPVQAQATLNRLKAIVGSTFKSETVQYELFYNQTGSTAGATALQDIAEVFQQRATELDSSGQLAQRFELALDLLSSNQPLVTRIKQLAPATADVLSQVYSSITTKIAAGWSYLLSNPPTESDYAAHDARLNALAIQGQKLMLIAHSQGNLFMNHAYDYVSPVVGTSSVRAVHIAPASPTLRGPYTLADIDVVINSLRSQGSSSVPANNITMPFASADPSGHTMLGTYLDSARGALAKITGQMTTAMSELQTPSQTASPGAFTVTLTWDGTGDVDLHTYEPSGAHVSYLHTRGNSGMLDVDNTRGYGPEHYYANCDSANLEQGTYRVAINNYANAAGRTATIQVASSATGVLRTASLDVGPVKGNTGNDSPIPVFNVVVSKNQSTGAYSFAVQ